MPMVVHGMPGSAAAFCHLHVLQWCQEQGCPWDTSTFVEQSDY